MAVWNSENWRVKFYEIQSLKCSKFLNDNTGDGRPPTGDGRWHTGKPPTVDGSIICTFITL